MDTIERIYNVKELKAKIKVAAAYQIFLKNQRKTEKLVGKRELEPWEAAMNHHHNRQDLAAMYVAYGVMRGKDLEEQIKNHVKLVMPWDENHYKTKIEKYISEYKLEVEVVDEN